MTIINQGVGISGKNYKLAQTFRVSLDEKTKGNFAERQDTVRPCKLIISCGNFKHSHRITILE